MMGGVYRNCSIHIGARSTATPFPVAEPPGDLKGPDQQNELKGAFMQSYDEATFDIRSNCCENAFLAITCEESGLSGRANVPFDRTLVILNGLCCVKGFWLIPVAGMCSAVHAVQCFVLSGVTSDVRFYLAIEKNYVCVVLSLLSLDSKRSLSPLRPVLFFKSMSVAPAQR